MSRVFGNYLLNDDINTVATCKSCGKKYKQRLEEQMAGFRQMDYDTCPYCEHVNGKSMSYEYFNEKMEHEA